VGNKKEYSGGGKVLTKEKRWDKHFALRTLPRRGTMRG